MSQEGLKIFRLLPPELQLQVLKRCDVESIKAFMKINENYKIFCQYAIRDNLRSLFTENQFELSIFTPQQENIRAVLYKTSCSTELKTLDSGSKLKTMPENHEKRRNTHDHQSYLYGLQLTGTRDVLADKTFKAEKGTQETNTTGNSKVGQPFIHLVVSEGVKYIPLHLSLYARSIDASHPALETCGTIELNGDAEDQSGSLSLNEGKFCMKYILEGEGEIPPRSPYDYDVVYGYKLKLSEFRIDNLHLFEGLLSLHQECSI